MRRIHSAPKSKPVLLTRWVEPGKVLDKFLRWECGNGSPTMLSIRYLRSCKAACYPILLTGKGGKHGWKTTCSWFSDKSVAQFLSVKSSKKIANFSKQRRLWPENWPFVRALGKRLLLARHSLKEVDGPLPKCYLIKVSSYPILLLRL